MRKQGSRSKGQSSSSHFLDTRRNSPSRSSIDSRFSEIELRRESGDNLPEVVSGLVIRSASAGLMELIANGYDSDAERVDLHYIPEEDRLVVSDDGAGMTPKELVSFYRLGDSPKVFTPFSEGKARPRLGKFGVATIVLKQLADQYTLTTVRDGLETKVVEDFRGKKLNKKDSIPFTTKPTNARNGTILNLQGLKFKEGEGGFSMSALKRRVQTEFRRLARLPDFSIYVNDEEIRPSVIENATPFKIEDKGRSMGTISGTAYLTTVPTEMAGIHVSIYDRVVGNPQRILGEVTDSLSMKNRIIIEVAANDLGGAVLLDRGMFREDDLGYVEFMKTMKGIVREVRGYSESHEVINNVAAVKKARGDIVGHVRTQLINAGVEGIGRNTAFEFEDTPPEDEEDKGLPGSFSRTAKKLVFNEASGLLHVSASTKKAVYEHALLHATVEALAVDRVKDVHGEDSLDAFFKERAKILSQLEAGQQMKKHTPEIHHRIVYSFNDIAELSLHSLGAIRYMSHARLFPVSDETVVGRDFIATQERTRGMTTLFDVLGEKFPNMTITIPRYHSIFSKLDGVASPFVRNFSSEKDRPCYFVEQSCSQRIGTILHSGKDFDLRSIDGDPDRAFKELGNQRFTSSELARYSEGLSLDVVNTVIGYAHEKGAPIIRGGNIIYRDFVGALQDWRNNAVKR